METIAFARGVPAPEMLPVPDLRDAMIEAFDANPDGILSYGTGGGYEPLRSWLADRHGVPTSRVVVTTGSLQGFAILVDVLAERARAEGRQPVAVVENPSYDRPLLQLRRAGWEIRPVAVDAGGVRVDRLQDALDDGVDLVYLIPTFQNPAGCTLTEERRREVLEMADSNRALFVEDDPYGELWFDTPPPPSLFGRADRPNMAYSSSFSKTVSPGLRVGYFVLPQGLADAVTTRANDTYISPTFIGQGTVVSFAQSGRMSTGIEQCRAMLHKRCQLMCSAIDDHLADATYVRPDGGYFLWLTLPEGASTDDLVAPAADLGVTFVAGSAFGPGNERSLRLAFSSPPLDSIQVGIERIAQAHAQLLAQA